MLCIEHDLHFLPNINASSARISALVGAVAAVCGVYASLRCMRSTMVILTVLSTLLQGKAFDPTLLNANGGWVLGPNSAPLPHYFTLQGCMSHFAPLVRPSLYPHSMCLQRRPVCVRFCVCVLHAR